MTEQSSPSAAPSRRPLWLALGGCALLLVCGLVVVGVGAGAWLFQRGRDTDAEPAVEYILDASPRMTTESDVGGARLTVAQGVLAEIVRPADPSLTAGLRVFGTGAQVDACKDTDLVVPLAPSSQGEIASRLLDVKAGAAADAAVGEAMIAAIRDLANTAGPHTLVVITGGADSCNAEAGLLVAQEAERAGIDLQTFVVGYQVPAEDAVAIRSLADAAGDSTYLEALDAEGLRKILEAIQQFVDDPTTTFPTVTLGTPAVVAVDPGATLAPGETPIAPPEATPAGLETEPGPDATEATVPGATEVPGGYQAQTACDHPYWPLRPGASWTYAFSEGTYTWSVTDVSGDLDHATATMHLAMAELAIDYHWTCTRAGLVSYDFGNISLPTEGGTFNFTVTSEEGAWLLPADELVPGAAWVNNYTMESDFSGAGVDMQVVTNVAQSFTVAGLESTTLEAGTFDALRVDSTGTYQSSLPGIPTTSMDTTQSTWFAYGVGMVRSESSSMGGSTTTTLVSYSIP
jgi:hypothetical protein